VSIPTVSKNLPRLWRQCLFPVIDKSGTSLLSSCYKVDDGVTDLPGFFSGFSLGSVFAEKIEFSWTPGGLGRLSPPPSPPTGKLKPVPTLVKLRCIVLKQGH
jgi:hypothetical protein